MIILRNKTIGIIIIISTIIGSRHHSILVELGIHANMKDTRKDESNGRWKNVLLK